MKVKFKSHLVGTSVINETEILNETYGTLYADDVIEVEEPLGRRLIKYQFEKTTEPVTREPIRG